VQLPQRNLALARALFYPSFEFFVDFLKRITRIAQRCIGSHPFGYVAPNRRHKIALISAPMTYRYIKVARLSVPVPANN
jgi:hypothetical protein